nr:uncharacterized protein LOC111421722 [Onthophagus taurus]
MLGSFTNYLLILMIITGHNQISCESVDLYWRDYNGTIPSDAYPAGNDIYIGQTLNLPYMQVGGLLPGGLYPDRHMVIVEAHGKRQEHNKNIKVLCTSTPYLLKWKWINTRDLKPNLSENCVIGGYEGDRLLFIGKIFHDGEWKIGKVFPPSNDRNGLRIWTKEGIAFRTQDFQILMSVNQTEL